MRATTASDLERAKELPILRYLGLTATEVDISQFLIEGKEIVRRAIVVESTYPVATEDSAIPRAYLEIAWQLRALFVGTLDLTEILLGNFPKDADQGDVIALAGVFRSEVKAIGKELEYNYEEAIRLVPGCRHFLDYIEEMSNIRFTS